MADNRCPLIENCQQKSAVCNVQLPDETCYWFRWFRALDNPWHTGTPTEEGWYIIKLAVSDAYFTNYWEAEGKWRIAMNYNFYAWQKIEPYKEKEDGRTD